MEYENEDETTWTRQIWYSQLVKVTLLQSRIETFQLFSQRNMWIRVKVLFVSFFGVEYPSITGLRPNVNTLISLVPTSID